MTVAKVIVIGRSQAIRLPKEFWVDADEVYLKRTREGFLVIVKNPWEAFFEGVVDLSHEFMSGSRRQPKLERRI